MSESIILVGDIGGTNIRYILYSSTPTTNILLKTQNFSASAYNYKGSLTPSLPPSTKNLISSLQEFLQDQPTPKIAVLGLPGIVRNNRLITSIEYGSWLSNTEISNVLNIPQVFLLNDLEASGYGLLTLTEDEYKEINGGQADPNGNIVCGSIGTGLGQCYLTKAAGNYVVHCSEGGFQAFSPNTEEENELFRFGQNYFGKVKLSYAKLVSGRNFQVIYHWLREKYLGLRDDEFDEKFMKEEESRAKVLLEGGYRGESELAKKATEMWEFIIGHYICNLFVNFIPTGGIYLIGGVTSKYFDQLSESPHIKAGLYQGVSSILHEDMSKVPIFIVKTDNLGTRGALHYARQHLLS